MIASGIQHHIDHTIDVAVSGHQATYIQAEPPCERGSHLLAVQLLLDNVGLDHVFGQGPQMSFVAQLKAQSLHLPQQAALLTRGTR